MSGSITHSDRQHKAGVFTADSFSLSSVFEKLRFRDRSVWKVGLTVKKAAFSNISGGVWTPAKGVFHSIKIPVQFLKIPLVNGTAFSGISGRGDNLAGYTELFEKILLGIFLPF